MELTSSPSPSEVTQPSTQDLCKQLVALFPLSTLEGSMPQKARISGALWSEARQNLEQMCALGADLPAHDRMLIETAAHIASVCHLNHSRLGTVKAHYTSHLLAVGRLVQEDLKHDTGSCSVDPALADFSTRGVAIATALLHDCIEDLWITVQHARLGISPELAPEVARKFIAFHLSPIIGPEAATAMVRLIDILSIENEHEFPTTEYVTRIKENQICFEVKLSDLTHNASTAPDFCPTYPIVYIAAQYDQWSAGAPAHQRLRELFLLNLNSFAPEQRTGRRATNLEEPPDFDYFTDLVKRYEGSPGIERMQRTFADIKAGLMGGAFATFTAARTIEPESLLAKLEGLEQRLIDVAA